jgi:uncharacterized integral membrane protein (TIGR00698 family)
MDFSSNIKGVLISFLIGGLSVLFVSLVPNVISGIILALILGVIVGNVTSIPKSYQSGIDYTSSKLLELSILFLAFGINYTNLGQLGTESLLVIIFLVAVTLVLTILIAKRINCGGSLGPLIGFGTAICGSSAIAALAPSISRDKQEVDIAMAVVNLLGSIGMIILPFVLLFLEIEEEQMGIFLGGSLHSVGNVAGASYMLSDSIGETAITIKLTRVALLTPGLIMMNYLLNKNDEKNWKKYLSLPWYLWCFVVITILTSLIDFPAWMLEAMNYTGKTILTIAMAAVGLNISIGQLISSGKKGLLFGVVIFVLMLLTLTALMLVSSLY